MTSGVTGVKKTSALMKAVLSDLPLDNVNVGYLVKQLGQRSFGGIIIILALLGLIPGVSILAGFAIVALGLQLLLGLTLPRLPSILTNRNLDSTLVRSVGYKVVTQVEKLERQARPRWLTLSRHHLTMRLIGLVTVGLGMVVLLPLPFTQLLPAVALLLISIGQLERDGMAISIGLILSTVALAIGAFFSSYAIDGLLRFLT